jgi:ankyrin repeat protein
MKMRIEAKSLGSCWMALLLTVANLAAASDDLRLLKAVKEKDQAAVRSLLEQRVDVNAAQPDGSTALSWAAHWDDLETAELLIQAGANVNAADDYGHTPLSLACANKNAAMVEKLLKAGANPNAALRSGETVLMTAADRGSLDVVRLLLAYGADVNAKETEEGQTALMWALAARHSEVARLLTEHGADVHARAKGHGFTPLMFAAQQGDLDFAKMALEAGADVDEATTVDEATMPIPGRGNVTGGPGTPMRGAPQGMTPLMMVIVGGHKEFAKFLLHHGADPNAADVYGFTPLHYAAWGLEMEDLAKDLLERGSDPNARLVRELHLSLVARLGGTRFSPIATGQGSGLYNDGSPAWLGATPLWLAAQIGNVKVMRILLDHGADPMIPTEEGTTPLLAAAGVGRLFSWMDFNRESMQREGRSNLEAVKLLVELGSDVNALGQNDWTALHGAAFTGENEIVKFLVEKGARLDAMSKFGETPLSTALYVFTEGLASPDVHLVVGFGRQFHKHTAELLLALGATPLEESGVKVQGGNTPTSSSGGEPAPTSPERNK